MRVLYISQTGMLEGLGRSQVLAYQLGLAAKGVEIDLISFELPSAKPDEIAALKTELTDKGIRWHPLRRARDPRLVIKLREAVRGVLTAASTALAKRPDIIHGRSYFATAVADVIATTLPRASLVFDCRGMIGDEYVDAGHWTTDRFEYKLVKRYEARAFHRSDGVVVLTDALRQWLLERRQLSPTTVLATIPCCVDLEAFDFDMEARVRIRRELGFEEALVLVYSGSLGSWYREDEMARFAGAMRAATTRSVRVLVLSRSSVEAFRDMLHREGFSADETATRSVPPAEVSKYLSASDVGLSFIKSCFSKKGSSPTKVAEYLACGLPVVLNGDIGDQAKLAAESRTCVVLDGYSNDQLARAAAAAAHLAAEPLVERVRAGREVADRHFGLETVGVRRYEALYRSVVDRSRGKASL